MMANSIAIQLGQDYPREVIATTLAAFALSSVLTGLSFFLLGALKLGVVVGFFPRHILVGCIGGIGIFLIQTGFVASRRFACRYDTLAQVDREHANARTGFHVVPENSTSYVLGSKIIYSLGSSLRFGNRTPFHHPQIRSSIHLPFVYV